MPRRPSNPVLNAEQIASLAERFNRHVERDPETGCLNWTGATTGRRPSGVGGYPELGSDCGATFYAHRVAYLIENGRWPEGSLHHRCENRACVAIEHLVETGSHAEHMAEHARLRAARRPVTPVLPFVPASTPAVAAA